MCPRRHQHPAGSCVAERGAVIYARSRPVSFRQLIEVRGDTSTLEHRPIQTKIYDVTDTRRTTQHMHDPTCICEAVGMCTDRIN